jgi:hypothetical protein
MVFTIILIRAMDFLIILIGLSIAWLFMYKIEWLFGFGVPFQAILGYSILLFLLSFLLLELNMSNPKIVVTLRMPIISFAIFKILHIVFLRVYKRNPENTFWVFEKKPVQDVVFSLLFWFLGVGLPFFLVMM